MGVYGQHVRQTEYQQKLTSVVCDNLDRVERVLGVSRRLVKAKY